MMFDSIPKWFSRRTPAGSVAGVRVARAIALPPSRGSWRLAGWPPLDRIGPFHRMRPSITLVEFG
jgi:hypothetical protein